MTETFQMISRVTISGDLKMFYIIIILFIIIIIIIASFMPHWKKLLIKVKADSEYYGIFR